MRTLIQILFILLLGNCLFSCEGVFNLTRFELPNFNKTYISPGLKFSIKHNIIQAQNGSYFASVASQKNEGIVLKVSEYGQNYFFRNFGPGTIHRIGVIKNKPDSIWLVMNNQNSAKLIITDTAALNVKREIALKPIFDNEIGLIQYIYAYSADYQSEKSIVIAGVVKQSLAKDPRFFFIWIDPSTNTCKLTLLNNNYVPKDVLASSDTTWVVSGYVQNPNSPNHRRLFLTNLNKNGKIKWSALPYNSGIEGSSTIKIDKSLFVLANSYDQSNKLLLVEFNAENGKELQQTSISSNAGIPGSLTPIRENKTLVFVSEKTANGNNNLLSFYKLGPQGQIEFCNQFEGLKNEYPYSIVQTKEGGFVACSVFDDPTGSGIRLLKTDEACVIRQ